MHVAPCVAAGAIVLSLLAANAAAGQPAENSDAREINTAEKAAGRFLAIVDQILAHHIDPPTRQQMALNAARILCQLAKQPLPAGLSGRISALSKRDQLQQLLAEVFSDTLRQTELSVERLEATVLDRLLGSLPGAASLTSAKDHAVEKQFASNRYVGTGIRLSLNRELSRPVMLQVIVGGPAHKIGARDGDIIEEIDGTNTQGKSLRQIIDMLRGPEGSRVQVVLRQPGKQNEPRKLTITRGVVPLKSLSTRVIQRSSAALPVGYVDVVQITASIPHELREFEQSHARALGGLILDLRSVGGTDVHHAVLIADALLEGGPIGRVRTLDGLKSYKAMRDSLFREIPLVVLVDKRTSGTAEWIAASLQDRRRAIIVGAPTSGNAYVRSAVIVPGIESVLDLATGEFERADGRRLLRSSWPASRPTSRIIRLSPRVDNSKIPARPKVRGPGVQPDHLLKIANNPREAAGGAIKRALELLRKPSNPPKQTGP